MQTLRTEEKISQALVPLNKKLALIEAGQNILLKVGNTYSLMKYEGHNAEIEKHNIHRFSRNLKIMTSNWHFADTKKKQQKLIKKQHREWKRYKGNIYGTHRLDFTFDEEFGIFLPSSDGRDMFLTLARETFDGDIVPRKDVIDIISDDDLIVTKLREITRPQYFSTVVAPFLENRCTEFKIPKRSKLLIFEANKFTLLNRFERATRDIKHGAFVYVGSKEEVYLLGLARGNNGRPYMQGTYSTSTKPMFYFSNNYLEFISRHDAQKPKFKWGGDCNVAVYRAYDIPGFRRHPFIFPQMGRRQNCKNTIFTGKPQLITGNVNEAIAHFTTTDFAEFADIVSLYAKQIDSIHPSSDEPNGEFYY